MAILPFVPFFVLKDFGQMMVFSSVYATLYLIAVRRLPQRIVLVGSVALLVSILVVGALPVKTQEKIPLLPVLAAPIKKVLPDRIQQRFHLWLDGFNPPSPDTGWWKEDYDDYYNDLVKRDPNLPELLEQDPTLQKSINVDAWFDILAFQPAQATFGLASGGTTGRGLGLGYVELIPISDSDYVYAALAEELGLFGGLLLIFALITFVSALNRNFHHLFRIAVFPQINKCFTENFHRHLRGDIACLRSTNAVGNGKKPALTHF
jgi:cell division protein FtsW (lipid II flippase)